MGLESKVKLGFLTTTIDAVLNWSRKNSLWPMPMGLSCCAIELMGMVGAKYDVSRFGAEVLRFSPRQSDLLIVSGTLTYKMAPVVKKIYDQMPEPKWVIAMGTCLCTGGLFDSYSVVQGLDKVLPVDIFIPGCPPRPEGLIDAIIKLQKKIKTESVGTYKSKADYKPQVRIAKTTTSLKPTKENTFIMNVGPSHPATHGVYRMVVEIDGEKIKNAEGHVGYLHRAFEKIAENRTFHQFIPYTDRLDYLAPISNNVSYILAVEKLLDIDVPKRAQYLRVIGCELARISSHLMAVGTFALDLGALSVWFYTWHQREILYEIFEHLTAIRFTTAWTRIGGLSRDLSLKAASKIRDFLKDCPKVIDETESFLTNNRIWIDRNKGVGVISKQMALDYGLTGPNLRATGIPLDLRKDKPYLVYNEFKFNVCTEEGGDCLARYKIRLNEMRESLKIIKQALDGLPSGPIFTDNPYVVMPLKDKVYTKMEELIFHFKIASGDFKIPEGEIYSSIENPKGEFGFYIISDGSSRPFRLRIKAPSFANIQIIHELVKGHMVPDITAIVASMDPVMGDCDR